MLSSGLGPLDANVQPGNLVTMPKLIPIAEIAGRCDGAEMPSSTISPPPQNPAPPPRAFLPYRCRSDQSNLDGDRADLRDLFRLTVPEWRVMAVLRAVRREWPAMRMRSHRDGHVRVAARSPARRSRPPCRRSTRGPPTLGAGADGRRPRRSLGIGPLSRTVESAAPRPAQLAIAAS